MGMDGCGNCLKYTFGFVNLVIFIGGAALLGVGITALAGESAKLSELLNTNLYTGAAIVLTVAGGLIVVISFLGCCGAFQESKCMLGTFFALVLVLFILVGAGAIAGFVLGGDAIIRDISKEMENSMINYDRDQDVKSAWNFMQSNFRCCGVDSRADWRNILGLNTVPNSCCKTDNTGKTLQCDAITNSYERGCVSQMRYFINNNSKLFGGITIGVAVLLLVSMICSCVIMKSIY